MIVDIYNGNESIVVNDGLEVAMICTQLEEFLFFN